ncbi:MAG: Acyltransferase family protein [Rhodoglobus sp.]|nr:Acyltransferase family protein [Rhodoglobus sp.]
MTSAGETAIEMAPPPRVPVHGDPPRRISISEALRGTDNALGLLRLILASLVIFDHAFPLGGYGHDPVFDLTRGQASLGSIAVGGFFAISGYLIAKSGMSADVVQFMWRRTLRIFPAYWLVLLVTALIVGPLIWIADGHELQDYFTFGGNGPVNYFTANWSLNIGTYGIHDLLTETTPYGRSIGGSAFNGSLWTLIYEWHCYLIVAVLVAFGVLRNARILVPVIAGFFLMMQVITYIDFSAIGVIVPVMADPYMITLGFTFLCGSVIAVYSKQILFDDRLGILAGLVLIFSLRYGGFSTIGTAAGAYFVLYLGARLPKKVHWIGAKNDYSYGVYIYGFLVQQVTAYLGWYKLGYLPYTLIALAISLGCAWLSWHLVEKHAMALKNWGPGRGIRYWYERARTRLPARKSKD